MIQHLLVSDGIISIDCAKYIITIWNGYENALLINNNSNICNREYKIQEIENELFSKHLEYNKLFEYINNNTKLLNIKFNNNISTNDWKTYGKFINCNGFECKKPLITLNKIIKTNENKIKLEWNILNNLENKNNFIIKYIIENESKESEWISINYKQIKCLNNNKFEIELENILKYNILYKYKIQLIIQNPIHFIIESNIKTFTINHKPSNGNAIKIPLQYHSHRGHWNNDQDYHPKQLLNSDNNKYYLSPVNSNFSPGESDWIIFKFSQLYFPTKFVIKNFYNTQGVKSMKIYIGDGNNKWYSFNSNETINVKKNNEYQSFKISGIDYKLIKHNQLKHIKIQFTQNHGCNESYRGKFCCSEFELFGLKF
eukprot:36550_1